MVRGQVATAGGLTSAWWVRGGSKSRELRGRRERPETGKRKKALKSRSGGSQEGRAGSSTAEMQTGWRKKEQTWIGVELQVVRG